MSIETHTNSSCLTIPYRAEKQALIERLNELARRRDFWKKKSWYYHSQIESLCSFLIPKGRRVLEIGSSTGDLLAAAEPQRGVGIDISSSCVTIAQSKYPHLRFYVDDAESIGLDEQFDYVILSDLIGYLFDIWSAFRSLQRVTHRGTRIIITYYNALWEPLLRFVTKLGLKTPQDCQNWLSLEDIENQLHLNGYEVIRKGYELLLPFYFPLVSPWVNRYLARLPGLRKLCLMQYIIARQQGKFPHNQEKSWTCSVIVPCKNEVGNIEAAVREIPEMGHHTEIVFVDGNSTDGTVEAIQTQIQKYQGQKDIRLIHQGPGRGKGDAVRQGFESAKGDFLFILDADLTVPPQDLIKFYTALSENQGELINGTRLVYPMQDEAMRSLNLFGNKFFSMVFSWLLDQHIKDTLCGTKAISKESYLRLAAGRSFFGDFDPFGDFDLLFGAAKLNFKIVEIPVRYRRRIFGNTKIDRFRHGWLLLKMCLVATRKLKFR